MNKSSNNWRVFLKSVWFGIIAGMISGMVKIGWEKILRKLHGLDFGKVLYMELLFG